MTDDAELLRRYASGRDERAFAELVYRRMDLVYGVALRHAGGNRPLAEDAAQVVFMDLARKATQLARHPYLVGWLHTAARFTAIKSVRAEARRRSREHEATAMNEPDASNGAHPEWERIQPALDAALGQLKERDRRAILARYFERKSLAEVADLLTLSETAARSLVDRALEKLRVRLAKYGATPTVAGLTAALADAATTVAPSHLAGDAIAAAFAGAATPPGLAAIAAYLMAKSTAAYVITGLLLASAGVILWQALRNAELRQEVSTLRSASLREATGQPARQLPGFPGAPRQASALTTSLLRSRAATPDELSGNVSRVALGQAKVSLAQVGNVARRRIEDIPGFTPEVIAAIQAWARQDPDRLIAWLGTVTSERNQREHSEEAVIAIETGPDPEFAFLLANGMTTETSRANRLQEVVVRWAAHDSAAALNAIASADVSVEVRARLVREATAAAATH